MASPTLDGTRKRYEVLWATMAYRPGIERAAEKVALRLLSDLPRYRTIERLTGVPAAFIMIAHERESGGNWNTYLGNGDPLTDKQGNRIKSVHEPAGRGPFASFEDGAIDALRLQGLTGIGLSGWTEARLCFWTESFNGFGYYFKGIPSPYLWAGTNHQVAGKYTSDGHFDPNAWDGQLGAMAVYGQIILKEPSLNLGTSDGDPPFLRNRPVQPAGGIPSGIPPLAGTGQPEATKPAPAPSNGAPGQMTPDQVSGAGSGLIALFVGMVSGMDWRMAIAGALAVGIIGWFAYRTFTGKRG